jgi:LmbE family N-acetylglucosaminyl deacetylase
MLDFVPSVQRDRPLRLLCIGAHSDDLEIGCGGTVLSWLASRRRIHVTWVVLTAADERKQEARRSATALLRQAAEVDTVLGEFRDGFLPTQYSAVKEFFESLKDRESPDVVLTHRLEDRHQDHRLVGELTWNTWRNSVILEYEIMKYEGDLGLPNVFVPIAASTFRRKAAHLLRHFGSQRSKSWFNEENFRALAQLRGMECRSPSGLAEAFHARKLCLAL